MRNFGVVVFAFFFSSCLAAAYGQQRWDDDNDNIGNKNNLQQERRHRTRRAKNDNNDLWSGDGYQIIESSSPSDDDESSSGSSNSGGDHDDGAAEQQKWWPAQELFFFRNSIDTEIFEWINPDEIQPGKATCGFLKAPLGGALSSDGRNHHYPTVQVYVCVRFAEIQPAPKGNLFMHCGGPGSLSGCPTIFGPAYIGQNNSMNYNIIGIDQRGMGRSWPSFAHVECQYGLKRNKTTGELVEEHPDGEMILRVDENQNTASAVDPTDDDSIRNYTSALKERVLNCWTCTSCDFLLNTTTTTDVGTNNKTYHFLEYSGTKQLVEDMNRFRQAIGSEKLSLYGVSYGTQVMSTYVTLFPQHVDKFVVDSNVSPTSNFMEIGLEFAAGYNERIDYLIYSCSARNVLSPGSCPVADMRKCINDFNKLPPPSTTTTTTTITVTEFMRALHNFTDQADRLCEVAATGDITVVQSIWKELYPEQQEEHSSGLLETMIETRQQFTGVKSSQPTIEGFYDEEDYILLTDAKYGGTTGWLVLAQDWSEGVCYDEDSFIRQTMEVNRIYPGAGTGLPAQFFAFFYGMGFYWPKGTPLPPRGNPFQMGIVSGQLFDSATPYTMTQKMRQNFMSTRLLTSQSINHGLASAAVNANDPSCQIFIQQYLETGEVGFVDGTICGAPFADDSAFSTVFGSEG